MRLQSLINALFKLSGTQAMPNARHSYQEFSGTGENQSFVSPINGYLEVQSAESNARIALTGTASWMFVSTVDTGIGTCGVFLPVAKGQNVTVWLTNGKNATLRWIKLVGGGINRLLSLAQAWIRGGVLWLTSSILSVRFLGSRIPSLFRNQIVAQSISKLAQRQITCLRHRVQDMFAQVIKEYPKQEDHFLDILVVHTQAQQQCRRSPKALIMVGLEIGSEYEKVIAFLFGFPSTEQRGAKLGSSQTREHNLIEAEVCHA